MRILGQALVVLALAVLAAAVAYGYTKSQPRAYDAVAQLGYGRALQPELQALGSAFAEVEIDEEVIATEARRVKSYDVASATAEAAPELGYDADAIYGRIAVTANRGAWVINVIARDDTPERAARLGRAYTNAYVALVRARERARMRSIEAALGNRLEELSEASSAGPLGATLRDQMSQAALIRRVGLAGPQVIENARASGAVPNEDTTRNVLFGLLFGLVAGIGLVALRSESGDRGALAAAKRLSGRR